MSQSLQLEGVDALRRILRQVHRDRILPFRPEQVGTVHLLELIDIARRLEVFLRWGERVEAIVDNVFEEQAIAPHDTFLLVLALNFLYPTLKQMISMINWHLLVAVVVYLVDQYSRVAVAHLA